MIDILSNDVFFSLFASCIAVPFGLPDSSLFSLASIAIVKERVPMPFPDHRVGLCLCPPTASQCVASREAFKMRQRKKGGKDRISWN